MASASDLAAVIRALTAWVDAPPALPVTLLWQAPGSASPVYLDVVGAASGVPADERDWLRLQIEPVEVLFVTRPGMRGDRVTLQNLIMNAGFDAPSGPGVVTVSDPRLNGDGSQGSAPFRRRKLRRSLGALPLTAAQATTIAQAWLAAYSQPTSKVEMALRAVRDANGAPLPLSHVRAGANLFTPELAARGQALSTGPQPGVNLFFIVETKYHETADDDITLTLQLDNYADRVEGLLARLRLTDDAARRRRGVYRLTQSPGAQQMGFAAIRAPPASAGQVIGAGVSFVPTLAKTPTGLTFTSISATNVGSGPAVTAGSLTPWGCEITVTAAASGPVAWTGT